MKNFLKRWFTHCRVGLHQWGEWQDADERHSSDDDRAALYKAGLEIQKVRICERCGQVQWRVGKVE